MDHLGPKMGNPHNFLCIHHQDCFAILHNEGANRDVEIMFFVKKILFRTIWLFWLQNGTPS